MKKNTLVLKWNDLKIHPSNTKSENFPIPDAIENPSTYHWNNSCYHNWSLFQTFSTRKSENFNKNLPKIINDYHFQNLRRYVRPKMIDSTSSRTTDDCSICLAPIKLSTVTSNDPRGQTQEVLELKSCSHYFHDNCLTTWLESKNECPLCRTSIFS